MNNYKRKPTSELSVEKNAKLNSRELQGFEDSCRVEKALLLPSTESHYLIGNRDISVLTVHSGRIFCKIPRSRPLANANFLGRSSRRAYVH